MEIKETEHNKLIATRVPPGDKWALVDDKKKVVHQYEIPEEEPKEFSMYGEFKQGA